MSRVVKKAAVMDVKVLNLQLLHTELKLLISHLKLLAAIHCFNIVVDFYVYFVGAAVAQGVGQLWLS